MIRKEEPTSDDPSIVNPLNGEPMERLNVGGVSIDRCPKTGAIWLDQGELARLALMDADNKGLLKELDQPIPNVARRAQRGALKSPKTGEPMMVVTDPQQKHVEFEVCRDSGGIFFDSGELADLVEYTFKERLKSFFG